MRKLLIIAVLFGLLFATDLTEEQTQWIRLNRVNVNPHPEPNKSTVIAINEGDTVTVIEEKVIESIVEKTYSDGKTEKDTTYTTKLTAEGKEIEKIGTVKTVIESNELERTK
jgi:hypothetical protein